MLNERLLLARTRSEDFGLSKLKQVICGIHFLPFSNMSCLLSDSQLVMAHTKFPKRVYPSDLRVNKVQYLIDCLLEQFERHCDQGREFSERKLGSLACAIGLDLVCLGRFDKLLDSKNYAEAFRTVADWYEQLGFGFAPVYLWSLHV